MQKLLVAEDEESNFLLIEEVLSGSGISLMHAWNGKQAVELVDKNHDIDLVLMDVKMPVSVKSLVDIVNRYLEVQ